MTTRTDSATSNPPENRRHGIFEWGLFGWFALLSWAGVILIIIAMTMGNGG